MFYPRYASILNENDAPSIAPRPEHDREAMQSRHRQRMHPPESSRRSTQLMARRSSPLVTTRDWISKSQFLPSFRLRVKVTTTQ